MLYRALKRLIERGRTADLAEKLDIFFAGDRLSYDEYNELTTMMKEV